jgi:hypothetical protein
LRVGRESGLVLAVNNAPVFLPPFGENLVLAGGVFGPFVLLLGSD